MLTSLPLPVLVAALGGIAGVIALVYNAFCKGIVEVAVARVTTNTDVHDNLLRLSVAALGAVCALVYYVLTAPVVSVHDLVVALLAGAGQGLVAVVEYHLAPVPAQLAGLVAGALAPPVVPVPAPAPEHPAS